MVTAADRQRLGGPLLQPAQVRLRSATGDDMEVLGSIALRGKHTSSGGHSSGGRPGNQVSLLGDRASS